MSTNAPATSVTDLETQVNKLPTDITGLEAHMVVMKITHPLDTYEEEFKYSEKISQLLRDRCLSLQAQLDDKTQRISELNAENTAMRIEAASASKGDDVTHAKVEERIEAAKAQVSKQHEDMEALRDSRNAWMKNAAGLKSQLDNYIVRHKLLVEEIAQWEIDAAEHLLLNDNAELRATQATQRVESGRSVFNSRFEELQKESKHRADQADNALTMQTKICKPSCKQPPSPRQKSRT
ncbi:hypothetical protein IQ07DRAFT_629944 [Pyrenochaeta sp. DS3sAY3a]|nr:hypothetical protein IQ07DRAFT_629944 [Pyrenochaeta sp. DS3sAY3a]